MKQLTVLFLVVFAGSLAGCSSLPKQPVPQSELYSRATAYSSMGNKNYTAGHYDKAGIFFAQALTIHASVDDQAGVSRSLTSLGRVDLAQGNTNAAEEKFKRALQSVDRLQQPDLAAHALAGLSAASLQENDPQTSLQWIQEGLNLPLNESCSERAVLLHDLGVAYQKLQKYNEAEISFKNALAMHETLNDKSGIAVDCYSLAFLFESTGAADQATPFALRALELDKICENPPGIAQDLTLLGLLYEQQGFSEESMNYYQRAQLVWQSLGKTEKSAAISKRFPKIDKQHNAH